MSGTKRPLQSFSSFTLVRYTLLIRFVENVVRIVIWVAAALATVCFLTNEAELFYLLQDRLDVEATFGSEEIRKVVIDQSASKKVLGADLSSKFLALIADLREARFLGELADRPAEHICEGVFVLRYKLGLNLDLELEPLMREEVPPENWKETHRIKLRNILKDGVVLI